MTASPAGITTIKSYVLRSGRITTAQAKYLASNWNLWGLPYQETLLDWDTIFGRSAPRILEIGFGMGETLAQMAEDLPEQDFIGVEVHAPGVGSLLQKIELRALNNVRIIRHDAVQVLQNMLAQASLNAIHVYFPDPWPKLRHHKRRLLQPAFVSLASSRLISNGNFHCATDWEEYAQYIKTVLDNEATLSNLATGYADQPHWRSTTKFELRGRKLGLVIRDLLYYKK